MARSGCMSPQARQRPTRPPGSSSNKELREAGQVAGGGIQRGVKTRRRPVGLSSCPAPAARPSHVPHTGSPAGGSSAARDAPAPSLPPTPYPHQQPYTVRSRSVKRTPERGRCQRLIPRVRTKRGPSSSGSMSGGGRAPARGAGGGGGGGGAAGGGPPRPGLVRDARGRAAHGQGWAEARVDAGGLGGRRHGARPPVLGGRPFRH